jgi:hypothetical protein
MRVAAAVEAGDHMHSPVCSPKEQCVWKPPAPGTTDVFMDDREMLWRCSDPFDNRLDFCGEAGS